MENHTVTADCVALRLRGVEHFSAEEAARLVRRALRDRGEEVWPGMHIDLFCRGGEALLIATPAPAGTVTLADYALPFLISRLG